MDLTPYVNSVATGVRDAAALADEPTRQIAERLAGSVESASRLALIRALSDAAAEISVELAPGSVDVRMSGQEPLLVVSLPPAAHDDVTVLAPQDEGAPAPDAPAPDGDEQQARVSLRLPQSVKEKVDELADADGVSTNTWLLHRILEALAERTRGGRGRGQGWGINIGNDGIRLNVPPAPPAPPGPPFGSGFPFSGDDPRPERNRGEQGPRPERGRHGRRDGGSSPVQGWVR